jgi:hypothetical protein
MIGNVFGVEEDATPIFPITIFHNDRLYGNVTIYLYCGKKVYAEDTVYISGMEVGRKELIEYKLNSHYSFKKLYECRSYAPGRGLQYENALIESLIHYVTGYFTTCEYSLSNIEKFQLKVLDNLDERSGVLVSPYVIREMCRLYRII